MAEIIVVGVDESETARKAAEKAASLAAAFGAELHVTTAFNTHKAETLQSIHTQSESDAVSKAYRTLVAQYAAEAEATASRIAEELRSSYPELKAIPKAAEGKPGAALSDEAARVDADLIVVGNKRVQGITRVLGSVARTLASETKCDLYIVHTHQR